MEDILKTLVSSLAEKADPTVFVLVIVIFLLAYLLVRVLSRVDMLVNELSKNSQTVARLTELITNLVYGRKRE